MKAGLDDILRNSYIGLMRSASHTLGIIRLRLLRSFLSFLLLKGEAIHSSIQNTYLSSKNLMFSVQ